MIQKETIPETRRAKMTLEAMRPAGSSATSTLSGGGGGPDDDGACGSGDAGSCELDVVLGSIGSASIPEPSIVIEPERRVH